MNAADRLSEIQKQIVARLDREAEEADDPIWWRIKDGVVQVGHRSRYSRIVWQAVPSLAAVLLGLRRRRMKIDPEIPW